MAIDASIPLQGLLINRNDENLKQAQYQRYQAQAQEDQAKAEGRRRLADLLPQAMKGDQAAMAGVAAIDTDVWSKLSTQQSAALKQNQEKILMGAKIVRQFKPQDQMSWDNARQAAARVGVDISDVPATYDPNYVNQLVTVADALEKQSGPEYRTLEPGGSLIDVSGGQPRVVIAPNDGGYQTGAPVQQGGGQPPAGAVQMLRANPQLKADFDAKYGQGAADRVLGGQSASPTGGFLGGF